MGGSEPSLLCGLREKAGPFFLDCVCSGSEAPTSTTVCPCDQPQHSGVDGPSRPGDPWSESVGQGQEGGSSVPGVTLHTPVPRVPPTVPAAPAWRKNTAVHGRCAVRACRCPLPLPRARRVCAANRPPGEPQGRTPRCLQRLAPKATWAPALQFSLAAGSQLRAVALPGPPPCPGVCRVWMCGFEPPPRGLHRATAIAEHASAPGCRSQRVASVTIRDSPVRRAPTSQNGRRGAERQGPAQGPPTRVSAGGLRPSPSGRVRLSQNPSKGGVTSIK